MKKTVIVCMILSLLLMFTGCSSKEKVDVVQGSDTLYVKKLDLKEGFIKGVDVSSVLSLEESGVKFYDYEGNEADIFKTLAQSGINYIRVRVWNKPSDANGDGYGGGNNDITRAVEIGKRATKYGMKLLVDFHYSDFWADPGKQMVPKEWSKMSLEEKAPALYEYTKASLQQLKDAKVDVGMVQIGNETNGAMCGEKTWMGVCTLMKEGSRAVREIFPEAKVAVHFANPENQSYENYASKLDYYSLDYDVFASSYYPYWHGTLENLISELDKITDKYGKEVMVMETSYAYTPEDSDFFGNTIGEGSAVVKNYPYTVQGQANCILDTMEAVTKMKNGIGLCYWEPAWITVGQNSYEENFEKWEKYGSGWASSFARAYDPSDAGKYYGGSAVDNQALFDKDGHPLESLKLFALADKGNEVALQADAIEDVTVFCDLNDEIVLPDKVNAVMNDNSKKEVAVTWKDVDYDAMKKGGVNTYVIKGEAEGREATCFVNMIEYNFLSNYSFEDGEWGAWKVTDYGKADQIYVEEKSTDSLTGKWHGHFWSAAKNSVNFDLEQEVKDLKPGKYKYAISIMGGDAGETAIYAYVKINGDLFATNEGHLTGYNMWEKINVAPFEVTEGDIVTVGIHIQCAGEGNGAWGKIDDALLNSVTE